MESGWVSKVTLQWGSTTFTRKSAEDDYKEALKQNERGATAVAEALYEQAIYKASQAYQCNAKRYAVCETLAKIHLDYGRFLKNQINKLDEARDSYQKAEQYIEQARDVEPHNESISSLTHQILKEYATFLRAQGKEEAAHIRFIKAVFFAPQTHLSNPVSNPAFEAHLAVLTDYSPPFFRAVVPSLNQVAVVSAVVSSISSTEEANQVLQVFSKIKIKNLGNFQELASLMALNDVGIYRALIRELLIEMRPKEELPLNPFLLGGLTAVIVRCIQIDTPNPQFFDDAVKVFEALVQILRSRHIDKNYSQVEMVLHALSLLLDQMVYCHMKELQAETVRQLHQVLDRIEEKKQLVLSWRVRYIRQALIHIPDNAPFLQALGERLPPVIGGLTYLSVFGLKAAAGATSGGILGGLELNSLWDAYQCFTEAFKASKHKKYEGWYSELRLLDFLIETNQIEKVEEFLSAVHEASNPQTKQLSSKWFLVGLCDRLERLAYSPHEKVLNGALRLLKGFKEEQIPWGRYQEVRDYAAICLHRIARVWPQPNIEQLETTACFPSVWHPFWHTEPSRTLLNQVRNDARDKAHIRQQLELLPAISKGVSTIQQRLSPMPASEWFPKVKAALALHYQPALKIQRISGAELDLEHCYINLVIVENQDQQKSDKAKLQAQAQAQASIPLNALFAQRKLFNGQVDTPKRIMIQGGAGIGKTTLCKKVVHYYQQGLWQERFDAVLWLPLRQLKSYQANNLKTLFTNKYFSGLSNGEELAAQLIDHTDRVLFILDGLDEVYAELNEGRGTPLGNLITDLLSQPQVIVTSRPAGIDVMKLTQFDLNLETIGFNAGNVSTYLQKVAPDVAPHIQTLLEHMPMMREFAKNPVQFDALCYSWEEVKKTLEKSKAQAIDTQDSTITMTTLYQVIVDKLWRKDAALLNKELNGKKVKDEYLREASPQKIAKLMAEEIQYLSYLSFKGLQDNLIEFDLAYLQTITDTLEERGRRELSWSLQNDIKHTSFLHTNDANVEERIRAYYFLHLTFQEFFAAKFLVKHLQACLTAQGEFRTPSGSIADELVLESEVLQRFMTQHQYEGRYQIVWWMVAGLLEGEALEGFVTTLLKKEISESLKDEHISLIMHCLHEARARLSEPTIQRLEKVLEDALLLAMESAESYEYFGLEIKPTFPEHLLLKVGKQHRQYSDFIYRILVRRQTLSEQAVAVLNGAFQDSDCNFESILIFGLEAYAVNVEAIRTTLLKRFEEEKNPEVSAVLAEKLGDHAGDVEIIRTAFLKRFEEEKNPKISAVLAQRLAQNAGLIKSIQTMLLTRFNEEKEFDVIAALVEGLGAHMNDVEAIRVMLLRRFEEEERPGYSAALVRGLGPHAGKVEVVRTVLLKRFNEESDPLVLDDLAWELSRHAGGIEEIRAALLNRLDEEKNPEIMEILVQAIGWSAGDVEAIRVALLGRLEKEGNRRVIGKLALGLGRHAGRVEEVRVSLLNRLEEEENPKFSSALAEGLGIHASHSEAIRIALLKRLEKETEPEISAGLVLGLGWFTISIETIRIALLKRFEEEKKPTVIAALAKRLGAYADRNESIRVALLTRFKNEQDVEISVALAEGLGMNAKVGSIRTALLIRFKEEQNLKIKNAIEEAFPTVKEEAESVDPSSQ